MMHKLESVERMVIHIQFEVSKVTLEIPRILFMNYFNVAGEVTENRIKMAMYRGHHGLSDSDMVKRQVVAANQNQFDSHERIFKSVMLGHPSEDVTAVEYYLQAALEHWLEQMNNRNPEPCEYLVTEIRRARAEPKVEVLAFFARHIRKDGSIA